MRYLKFIGLLVAVSLISQAGSASADVLCKAAPNKAGECSTVSGDYASGSVFTAESASPKLTIDGGSTAYVTCETSKLIFKNTSTGSNTSGVAVSIEVTNLVFTGDCTTAGGTACDVSEPKGYVGSIKATNDIGGGTLTFNGASSLHIKCGVFLDCTYEPTAAGLDLSFTGGNPASLVASGQSFILGSPGVGCGTAATWDGSYVLAGTNKAVWVATKND